uniref:Uncharacterized protein n=1 Tax=Musa acuminata subsp. malaccensis TaxID=214687 RepID=A0A804K607_MUSAM
MDATCTCTSRRTKTMPALKAKLRMPTTHTCMPEKDDEMGLLLLLCIYQPLFRYCWGRSHLSTSKK